MNDFQGKAIQTIFYFYNIFLVYVFYMYSVTEV
jgi:hypothetical protein